MHRKRARRILGFWKKSMSWFFCFRRRTLTFGACRGPCGMYHTWWWWWVGICKSQHRKIVYFSPYFEKEPFNSKVIKSFVSELRSRKCFFFFVCLFRDSYVIYIWVMNILWTLWLFHISITWVCYIWRWVKAAKSIKEKREKEGKNCHKWRIRVADQ